MQPAHSGSCGCGPREHPVDVLVQEHQVILAVLETIQQEVRALRAADPVRPEFWRSTLDFLTTFVDTCHHGKEEDVLFPALARNGLPEQQGPVGVMRHEHEHGRQLVRRIHADVAALAGTALAGDAQAYITFLREHIAKENEILFPLAKRVLPPDALAAMRDGFRHIESDVVGDGTHCRFLGLARELCEANSIPFDVQRDAGMPKGVCH